MAEYFSGLARTGDKVTFDLIKKPVLDYSGKNSKDFSWLKSVEFAKSYRRSSIINRVEK